GLGHALKYELVIEMDFHRQWGTLARALYRVSHVGGQLGELFVAQMPALPYRLTQSDDADFDYGFIVAQRVISRPMGKDTHDQGKKAIKQRLPQPVNGAGRVAGSSGVRRDVRSRGHEASFLSGKGQ